MTLYSGARTTGRTKLDGPERTLDALIGVIVFIAGLVIGFMAISALFSYGSQLPDVQVTEAVNFGFAIALFGGGIVFGIATLIFLVRLATGRRSWTAPLWGTILAGVAIVIGYVIMVSG